MNVIKVAKRSLRTDKSQWPKLAMTLVGYGTPFLASFTLIKILVILFGSIGFGIYAFSVSAATATRILIFNIAQPVIIRFYPEARNAGKSTKVLGLFAVISVMTWALGIVLYSLFRMIPVICVGTPANECVPVLIASGIALGAGLGASTAMAELDNAMSSRGRGILFLIFIPLSQIIIAVFSYYLSLSVNSYTLASSTGLLLLAILHIHLINKDKPDVGIGISSEQGTLCNSMAKFAGGLSLWIIPTMITKSADRFLFGVFLGPFEIGLYAVCLTLTQNVLGAINTVQTRIYNPIIFSKLSNNDPEAIHVAHRAVNRMSIILVLVGTLLALFYAVFAREILAIVSNSEMSKSAWLLQALSVGAFLQAAGDAQSLHGQVAKNTRPFFYSRSVAAFVLVICGLFFTPRFGLVGAAIAVIITQLSSACGSVVAGRFVQSIRPKS